MKNPQKVKMLYKKQMNSHRATSQATGLNAHRETSNIQSHRNNLQGNQFSPPRQPNSKVSNNQLGAAFYQSQRDHSNGPNTNFSYQAGSNAASSVV